MVFPRMIQRLGTLEKDTHIIFKNSKMEIMLCIPDSTGYAGWERKEKKFSIYSELPVRPTE